MVTKVGINGFGRIGRQVLKAIRDRHPEELEVVAFNDIGDLKTMAHLLKYDSNYGRFDGTIEVAQDALIIDGKTVKVFKEMDPAAIPWGSLGVDIVIESTGLFTIKDDGVNKKGKAVKGASSHIKGGAKKVIISAPAEGEDLTIVMGVNEDKYDPKNHHVVSNASCTTNCLAPAAKVVHDNFTIKRGFMTTVHAYTNDQKILDLPHPDLRRARAAAMSIIPTTTGAAKAISLVIPDLKGKFDGYALRVPVSTVSIVDFTVELEKETTTEELRQLFREAAKQPRFKGILQAVDEPLVSIDYKGDPHSSSIDLQFTMVLGKEKSNFVKVVTWYDNEWGYSCRTADLAAMMAKSL
ncbi:type I glyceraldehyde-3-phosphate dehydrogenase [Chloroflexota bacterium]